MEIVARYGREDLAILYLARLRGSDRFLVEFVEAVEPPVPREDKWVLMISSGFGCPVRCAICDAGTHFHGWLTAEEIVGQIDFLAESRFGSREIPVRKFKIQFARMGEPALNPAVLDVLEELPDRYRTKGLTACVSTIAPAGSDEFFRRLIEIKNGLYAPGRFRLQFSIHSTDPKERSRLIPLRIWSFERIADYGRAFFRPGDAKICLNFAPAEGSEVSPEALGEIFDPALFIVKLTPINPTDRALGRRIVSLIDERQADPAGELVYALKKRGFDVIVSIGATEENSIGTNCGQMATRFAGDRARLTPSYPKSGYHLGV